MQAGATTRNLKPRRAIDKSTTLERVAPQLADTTDATNITDTHTVSAARSIENANATADRVRSAYFEQHHLDLGDTIEGDDEAANARRYERRTKMNRYSAAASRVRREAYVKALEAELLVMESDFRALLAELEDANEINRQLEMAQDAQLTDDGHAPQVKQEDEIEPNVEEVGDTVPHPNLSDSADDTFSSHDQLFDLDPIPLVEDLLTDPSFIPNADILQSCVPDNLPECFLNPPGEDARLSDESE